MSKLPLLNALLNSITSVLLVSGVLFVKNKKIFAHRVCMGLAFFCSAIFLTSYLIYHYSVGHVPFKGEGAIRSVYFFILTTHTILAVSVLPLAITTAIRAFKNQLDRHRSLAKWTFPIWLYVSVTGVMVYWMLYQY